MRLIDADMADVIIIYDKGNELMQVSAVREYTKRQKAFLDKFPTIDAVPVVRCKNCVHGTVFVNNQGAEYVDCVLDDYSVRKPTDYCSYGKRKEGADR